MKKLSIVVPVYNEEENFNILLTRTCEVLSSYDYEIMFVDDGSLDNTRSLIETASKNNTKVKGIVFSRNFGHQAAVKAGIEHAKGDVVVIMDGDLQDPPEVIPKFLEKIEEGFDVVYAIRKKRKENFFKRFCYSLFYKLLFSLSDSVKIPKDSGDFGAIRREVVDAMRQFDERNQYVRGIRSWVGFRQVGIEYERDKRYAGEVKYTFRKLIKLAYDGIFSFSYKPLSFITFVGFLTAIGAFLGILIVIYFKLFTSRDIPGFASTASIILFIGGVQMLSLGILGEYIKRIYDEVKKRPRFIISKFIGE